MDDLPERRPESPFDYIKAFGFSLATTISNLYKPFLIAVVGVFSMMLLMGYVSTLELPVYVSVPVLLILFTGGIVGTTGMILYQLDQERYK
jgi:hypothetical protein